MISLNTNTASMAAAYNLSSTSVHLQRSLNRLSSGSRINSSFDDAGGLAVSMKLSASIRRTEATQANVNNALSMMQTQDGVLKTAEKVLTRLSELAQLSTDVTKSTTDRALYQTEYNSLTTALDSMTTEVFNSTQLFVTQGGTQADFTVVVSHDGGQTISVAQADLGDIVGNIDNISISGASGATTTHIDTLNTAIKDLATLRARNGSDQQRLTFAADVLALNKTKDALRNNCRIYGKIE